MVCCNIRTCHPAARLGEWLPQEMPGDDWGRAGAARQEGGSGLAGPGNSANCLKKCTIFFCHRRNDRQWIFFLSFFLSLGLYLLFWWIYFTFCFFCKAHFQLFYALIKKICGKRFPAFFFCSLQKRFFLQRNNASKKSFICAHVKRKTSTCF